MPQYRPRIRSVTDHQRRVGLLVVDVDFFADDQRAEFSAAAAPVLRDQRQPDGLVLPAYRADVAEQADRTAPHRTANKAGT